MELHIPKLREGSYFPSLLEPRRRSEKALLSVIQQAYVEGVSTRRVDDLIKALGCDGISSSQVSRICEQLDEVVESFLGRPPDRGRYGLKSGCDIAWEGAPPSGILVVRPPDAGDPRCAFPANAIRCKKRLNRIYLTSPSHN